MANSNDEVAKVYADLMQQLSDVEPSHEIAKTAKLLGSALRTDGFGVPQESDGTRGRPRKIKAIANQPIAPVPATQVYAFRMAAGTDAKRLASVFDAIPGWSARTIDHNGKHIVVAGNVGTLSTQLVRQALAELIAVKQQEA